MRIWVIGSGAVLALALLTACGNPAATPEREESASAAGGETSAAASTTTAAEGRDAGDRRSERADGGGDAGDRRSGNSDVEAAPLPATHASGAPSWAANRRNSAAERAQIAFERNGSDFGARTRDAYVDAAHAFIRNPPEGTLTATRRNGDRLMYDPRGNVFAVASREGAPRTMFKPEEGMAYWREQEQRIASGGRQQARSRSADE